MYNLDDDIVDYLKDINHDKRSDRRRIPKSAGFISPGKVLVLSYPEDGVEGAGEYYRIAIVVSTLYGNGLKAFKPGYAISCFRLNDTPWELATTILKLLYNNRRLCSYDKIQKSLLVTLGQLSFRTYYLYKINDLYRITIDKNKLPNPLGE